MLMNIFKQSKFTSRFFTLFTRVIVSMVERVDTEPFNKLKFPIEFMS